MRILWLGILEIPESVRTHHRLMEDSDIVPFLVGESEIGPVKSNVAEKTRAVRWRSVALPAEHGGWGFLIEPILLGLLVTPSAAGFLLAVAAVAGFLLRQPLKTLLIDRRRGVNNARTLLAFYGAAAGIGLLGAIWLAGPRFLGVLALALPAALLFAYYDLTRPGRTLQAELAAPAALAVVAPAMAVMADWTWPAALALWVVLVARAVPTVAFVRARIRLDKGRATNIHIPILLHIVAVAVVVWLVTIDLLPRVTSLVFALFFMRAMVMLAPKRPAMSVKTIGIMELLLGIGAVVAIAIGFWRG